MKVTIFHPDDTPFKEVLITDRSMRKRTLMGDNYVQLYLESSQNLSIPYNSYIEYEGERFYTMQTYRPLRIKGAGYIYEIKFCGIEMLFANDLFFRYVTVTTPTCKEYKEPDFVLNCNLSMIAEIMLTTLNKEYSQYQWTLYTPPTTEPPTIYPKATPLKNLAFSGITVLEALNRIAKEFETEWWIEQDENPEVKILHFDKCEQGSEYIELSRSYHLEEEEPVNGGLKDFSFDQSQYVIPQKVYAYGSERNIQAGINAQSIPYHTRLQLPQGREYIEIENHTTKGSVVNFFEEVYPTLRGTVTEMRCEEGTKYFIKDSAISFLKKTTESQDVSVYFDSGILQGYTFQADIENDFLELHTITSGSFELPNPSLPPSIGDHFSLFNVELPLGAIHQAQQELLAKTIDYVNELANRIPRIACTPHPIEFRKKVPHLSLGLKIRIKDPVFQGGAVQARISEYQYPLNQKHLATFYLDNAITHGKLLEMKDFISKLDREVIDTKTLTHHSVSMNSETGAIISQTLQYEILTDTPSLTPRTTYVKANSIKRFSKGPTSYPAQLGCICYFTDQDPQTLPAEESGSDFIRVKVPQASIVKMVFFQKSDDPVLKRLPDKELLYIQDGLTPSINEHNYWVIGKDVTEVSAIGAPNQSFTCPNFNIIYDPVGKKCYPSALSFGIEIAPLKGAATRVPIGDYTVSIEVCIQGTTQEQPRIFRDMSATPNPATHTWHTENINTYLSDKGISQGGLGTQGYVLIRLSSESAQRSFERSFTQVEGGPPGPAGKTPYISANGGVLEVDGLAVLDVGQLSKEEVVKVAVDKDTYASEQKQLKESMDTLEGKTLQANVAARVAAKNIPLEGLEMFIPLSENAQDVYGGHTITPNAISYVRDEKFGKVAEFDGSNSFATLQYTIQQEVSISAWVFCTDKEAYRSLFGCHPNGINFGQCASPNLYFIVHPFTVTLPISYMEINVWQQFTMVCKGGSQGYLKVYKNGRLIGSVSGNTPIAVGYDTWYLGADYRQDSHLRRFKGKIANFTMHHRVLATEEIEKMNTSPIASQIASVANTAYTLANTANSAAALAQSTANAANENALNAKIFNAKTHTFQTSSCPAPSPLGGFDFTSFDTLIMELDSPYNLNLVLCTSDIALDKKKTLLIKNKQGVYSGVYRHIVALGGLNYYNEVYYDGFNGASAGVIFDSGVLGASASIEFYATTLSNGLKILTVKQASPLKKL